MAITPVTNTILGIKLSGASYTEIGQITQIGDNSVTSESIVINYVNANTPTKLGSGRKDPGQWSCTVAWDQGSAQHAAILACVGLQGTNAVKEFQITSPGFPPQPFTAIIREVARSYADQQVNATFNFDMVTAL
jgi:hypothetical protein